uniref:Uncharacterized protein n=1 Tax=Rhizophora mucronata TaxID=61149 RepID=A0A2P2QBT1_RHIMU
MIKASLTSLSFIGVTLMSSTR